MLRKMKKLAALLCAALCMIALPTAAMADAVYDETICLGGNLTEEQKAKVLESFDLTAEEAAAINTVTVQIDDEKELLGDYISADKIGTRSLSSVYIRQGVSEDGIQVETHNITYVTAEMYTNAMITAGIDNAKVIVAAPVNVSGTAALAGIYKAYEAMVGDELEEEAKDVAGQELITTADLADYLGSDEAAALMAEIKSTILDKAITDPEMIRSEIRRIADENNITLTDEQVESILALMQRLAQLDLDPKKLADQLTNLQSTLQKLEEAGKVTTGFFGRVSEFVEKISGWFKNMFSNGGQQ